jgi:hypothetical protein
LIVAIGQAFQRVNIDALHLAAVEEFDQPHGLELLEHAANGLDSEAKKVAYICACHRQLECGPILVIAFVSREKASKKLTTRSGALRWAVVSMRSRAQASSRAMAWYSLNP